MKTWTKFQSFWIATEEAHATEEVKEEAPAAEDSKEEKGSEEEAKES